MLCEEFSTAQSYIKHIKTSQYILLIVHERLLTLLGQEQSH